MMSLNRIVVSISIFNVISCILFIIFKILLFYQPQFMSDVIIKDAYPVKWIVDYNQPEGFTGNQFKDFNIFLGEKSNFYRYRYWIDFRNDWIFYGYLCKFITFPWCQHCQKYRNTFNYFFFKILLKFVSFNFRMSLNL